MDHMLHLCAQNGIDVVRTFTDPDSLESRGFQEGLADVDAILVNGEGTMHHDTRDALALSRAIVHAKRHGKKTALVNALWQDNRVANTCLRSLDFISARDSLSKQELCTGGALQAHVAPDLSLYRGAAGTPAGLPRGDTAAHSGIVVVDSVDENLALRLKHFASAHQLPFRVMQDWRVREDSDRHPLAREEFFSLADFAGTGLLISGRFHAVCFAVKYGCPFLAVPSNTRKLEGLLRDAGLPAADFVLPLNWEGQSETFWMSRTAVAWQRHAPQVGKFAMQASATIERTFAMMAETLGARPPRCSDGPTIGSAVEVALTASRRRKVRVCYFNNWAAGLEDAAAYVARAPALDLTRLVANPRDPKLLRWARLDCDWYMEIARCFLSMTHEAIEFLPAWTCGAAGIVEFASAPREPGEERWFLIMGRQPQHLGTNAGKVFGLLSKMGVRHFYYAFDEASRFMPCFPDIAPYLDVLIHDEFPLDEKNRLRMKPSCRTIHRSWVANMVPFAAPFNETPEEKIIFLGSPLGLTENRKRQIAALGAKFKDRFVPMYEHSPAANERVQLNRYKVALCPEGRWFTTPGMAKTHTDRPFWSGCLGMVVVSEDSKSGGRLQELHEQGLILRYDYADTKSLVAQCERALAMTNADRRRSYDHFNRFETVGTVVATTLAAMK